MATEIPKTARDRREMKLESYKADNYTDITAVEYVEKGLKYAINGF